MDFISICPECKTKMKRKELSGISKLFAEVFK